MAQATLDYYIYHPCDKSAEDDVSAVAYATCHDAVESDGCNTGAYKYIQQNHKTGDIYAHSFGIRRLAIFFWIDIPVDSIIASATLKLGMYKDTSALGEEDWDWTLSIRHNNDLSAPGVPGDCPVTDYPLCLGGTQIATKYVDDMTTSVVIYEFNLPLIVIPQTYLKLALVSSKDLAGIAPDDTVRMLERVVLSGSQQLTLVYDVIPTVTTKPADGIFPDRATLNGLLDDGAGEACNCGFEWGITTAYGNTTSTQSKTTGQSFSQEITNLDAGTIYHFRAFATNTAGTAYGEDKVFTTLSDSSFVDETVIGNKVSLEAIRNIEIVYGGRFYMGKSGNATYESRYHRNV